MYLRKTQQGIDRPFTLTQCGLSSTIISISCPSLSFLIGIHFSSTTLHDSTFPHTYRSVGPREQGSTEFLLLFMEPTLKWPSFPHKGKLFLAQETQLSSYQTNFLIESSLLILNLKLKVKAIPVSVRIIWWQLDFPAEDPTYQLDFPGFGQWAQAVNLNLWLGYIDFHSVLSALSFNLSPEFISLLLLWNPLIQDYFPTRCQELLLGVVYYLSSLGLYLRGNFL